VNTIIALCLWSAFSVTSGVVALVIGILAICFTARAAFNWLEITSRLLVLLFVLLGVGLVHIFRLLFTPMFRLLAALFRKQS
jgi:hypothetical protein